jgi:tRNA-Thr(GGU) m(6)t(6)A37 methyltransferase TsaA
MSISFEPIGVVHSEFQEPRGVPVQGALEPETEALLELFPEYAEGLKDVDGFSHLIVLYHFHRVGERRPLLATPFLDEVPRGIFAIRGPRRPNPIGLTVVRLIERRGRELRVGGIDMIEGTPILDIKPYIPRSDSFPEARVGWLEGKLDRPQATRSDGRFDEP